MLILRLLLGLLMLLHGIGKLIYGVDFISQTLSGAGLPGFIAYGVYLGEVLAPIALIVGYKTRLAAVLYFVNCLVAVILMHSRNIFKLNEFGGWAIELLALYMFGAMVLFFTGAGKFAVSKNRQWD